MLIYNTYIYKGGKKEGGGALKKSSFTLAAFFISLLISQAHTTASTDIFGLLLIKLKIISRRSSV
jgi:hypothetical protein